MMSAMWVLAAEAGGAGGAHTGGAHARPMVADLLILLSCTGLLAMALGRLRLATIPAYLICGAIIGPSALGFIVSLENVEAISGLAMVLLMFTIGLHLDPASMRGGMVRVLALGSISTGAVVMALTPLGLAGDLSLPASIAVAMGLSMSSTAVVLSLLQKRREMHRLHGRLCVGIEITQDLLSLVFLALMPVLAKWHHASRPAPDIMGPPAPQSHGGGGGAHAAFILDQLPEGTPEFVKAALAVLGIAAMIVLARVVLPRVLREAVRTRSSEVPLVVTAAAALLAASCASGLGFSPELGAFLAGFILAGTPFRAQLAGQLSPMRDLFMAVFFTSVGLRLDLGALASVPGVLTVLLTTLSVIVVKAAVTAATTWAMGATAPVSALVGLTLAQAGEFTIVVLTPAVALGMVSADDFAIVIAVVVVTLIVTPSLNQFGRRMQPRLARIPLAGWNSSGALRERTGEHEHAIGAAEASAHLQAEGVGHAGHATGAAEEAGAPRPLARYVIIAGFGVVGRALADRLRVAQVPMCVVDMNRQTVETQRALGRRAVYGDVSNPEVLEAAGIEHADAVMLTIPDDEATLRACEAIRRIRADVYIAVRTSFLSKAMEATMLGADQVIVEEVATAETMARQVLDALRGRAAKTHHKDAETPRVE